MFDLKYKKKINKNNFLILQKDKEKIYEGKDKREY